MHELTICYSRKWLDFNLDYTNLLFDVQTAQLVAKALQAEVT